MATENDVVLIYFEDTPLSFARIEKITSDSKPDWYHVKLLLLQVPLQVVTWILRDIYINGETFTMNEKRMRLEKIVCPEDTPEPDTRKETGLKTVETRNGNIISLRNHKKKDG
jgi:hypothetical protein